MEYSNEKILLVTQRRIEHRMATPEGLDALRGAGSLQVLDLLALEENRRADAFDEAAAEVDAVVSLPWGYQGIPPLTKERLQRMPKLRVISGTYDNRFEGWLDVAGAQTRGIQVIDTSRSMTPTVAEFALAMIINLLRDIPDEVARVRAGDWFSGWQALEGFVAGDLSGRRVGLAGFGIINRSLARFLTPFQCQLSTYDPFVDDGIDRVPRRDTDGRRRGTGVARGGCGHRQPALPWRQAPHLEPRRGIRIDPVPGVRAPGAPRGRSGLLLVREGR